MSLLSAFEGSITTLFALLLLTTDSSLAISCQEGTHSFPPDSCVSLLTSNKFKTAESTCMDNTLDNLAVLTDEQLKGTLSIYAASVLKEGELLWIGYYLDVTGDVHASPSNTTITSGPLVDANNFDLSDAVDLSEMPCVAVDSQGAFHRRRCDDNLMALCQKKFEAPSATLSVQGGGGNRFITAGSSVTLSCAAPGTDVSVGWLFRSGSSDPMPIANSNGQDFIIASFSAADAGSYYCVATNSLGGFVSTPITLSTTGSAMTAPTVSLTSNPSEGSAVFNAQLTLTCSYDTAGAVLQWFINGESMVETGSATSQSMLVLDRLIEDGYYQCVVVTQNGEATGASLRVLPQPGVPGPVAQFVAEAMSDSALSLSWLCPLEVGTYDPILLRYTVLYNQGVQYDASLVASPLVTLAVEGGDVLKRCTVMGEVTGLSVGTTYSVTVRADTNTTMGEMGSMFAVASTYGLPPGLVQNLKVYRSMDNKTVYGNWDSLETELPVGRVTQYEIQYRQYLKNSLNTVFLSHQFNTVIISNVVNANSYEIRLRAGIISTRNPLTHSYGDFTSWERVQGFTTDPPTVKGGLKTRAGAIAAGVIVGVLVLVAIFVILIVGVVCIGFKRGRSPRWSVLRKSTKDFPLQPTSDE